MYSVCMVYSTWMFQKILLDLYIYIYTALGHFLESRVVSFASIYCCVSQVIVGSITNIEWAAVVASFR